VPGPREGFAAAAGKDVLTTNHLPQIPLGRLWCGHDCGWIVGNLEVGPSFGHFARQSRGVELLACGACLQNRGRKTGLSENGPAGCAVGAPMEAKPRIAREARLIHSEKWCKCGRRICGRHRATSLPILTHIIPETGPRVPPVANCFFHSFFKRHDDRRHSPRVYSNALVWQ
jgi:hypothetical protein